jgi:hypothetical protein
LAGVSRFQDRSRRFASSPRCWRTGPSPRMWTGEVSMRQAMSETTERQRSPAQIATQFQVGNPGRPKGSKNKLTEDFLRDVLEAWTDKGKAAMDAMIAEKPGDFVKMVAGLMPKEATLTINDHSEMTDDELAERVRSLAAQLSPFLVGGTGDAATGADDTQRAAIASRVH